MVIWSDGGRVRRAPSTIDRLASFNMSDKSAKVVNDQLQVRELRRITKTTRVTTTVYTETLRLVDEQPEDKTGPMVSRTPSSAYRVTPQLTYLSSSGPHPVKGRFP